MDEILNELKNDYVSLLGKKSLNRLVDFVLGFQIGNALEFTMDFRHGFLGWIQKKYEVYDYYNWDSILLWNNAMSDSLAFDAFFTDLATFIESDEAKELHVVGEKYSLYTLFSKTKNRPALFFGNKGLKKAYFFLNGYDYGFSKANEHRSELNEKFQKWIEIKFGVTTGQEWYRIINFYSETEDDAIKNFYQLFDEFLIDTTGKNIEQSAK
ncbi:hypothetical protein FH027_14640 [Listeria monocytogenes]|nr:hypothetical protein [Listeria monocytogenes]